MHLLLAIALFAQSHVPGFHESHHIRMPRARHYKIRYEAHDERTADPVRTRRRSPASDTTAAGGFTCKDGSHSNAHSRRGACSRHGGIQD